jgi:hypothetical protein
MIDGIGVAWEGRFGIARYVVVNSWLPLPFFLVHFLAISEMENNTHKGCHPYRKQFPATAARRLWQGFLEAQSDVAVASMKPS